MCVGAGRPAGLCWGSGQGEYISLRQEKPQPGQWDSSDLCLLLADASLSAVLQSKLELCGLESGLGSGLTAMTQFHPLPKSFCPWGHSPHAPFHHPSTFLPLEKALRCGTNLPSSLHRPSDFGYYLPPEPIQAWKAGSEALLSEL